MDVELTCPICSCYFMDPVMLQCTHHVCQEHLPPSASGLHTFQCPKCNEVSAVPEGGFPVDNVVELLVKLWQGHTMAEGGAAPAGAAQQQETCGMCEERLADRRCVQCAGSLCEECAADSHSKGFFKSHNIVVLEPKAEGANESSDAASYDPAEWASKMLCHEHTEEKLNFYCLDCRTAVCSHCLIMGSHKNHQQTQIAGAFEAGKDTLRAWQDKLSERVKNTDDLMERLRQAEVEVESGVGSQRAVINQEIDNLTAIVENKRKQLLQKSAGEENLKRDHLHSQIERTEQMQQETRNLVSRSWDILALPSEHAFLAVVLPVLQDMKKCQQKGIDSAPGANGTFRPLSTDPQVRSLGDIDLGLRAPPVQQSAAAGATSQYSAATGPPQYSADARRGGASSPWAPLQYFQPQAMPISGAPVQYVYR